MLPVAILAGGLATRLRPLTETISKSLVEIHGEPFLWHQLRLLRENGIESIRLGESVAGLPAVLDQKPLTAKNSTKRRRRSFLPRRSTPVSAGLGSNDGATGTSAVTCGFIRHFW